MERRIVTQLMTCMDEYHRLVQPANANSDPESSDEKPGNVLVIGATNRPDAIDPALRRPGRFDREIRLGVPDENARVEILSVLTRKCTLEGSLDLLQIARSTPGFVGADLDALVDKAGNLAMRRILSHRKSELTREYSDREYTEEWWKMPWLPEEIEKLAITMSDFEVIFSYIMCLCCTCACVNMDASPFFSGGGPGGCFSKNYHFAPYIFVMQSIRCLCECACFQAEVVIDWAKVISD